MRSGRWSASSCRSDVDLSPNLRTEGSSTPCSFGRKRACLGATSPSGSARGRPSSIASQTGRSAVTGQRFSKRFSWRSTMTESSSTLRSSERTRTLRAEKGGHHECTGSFSRWVLHQGPCARRLQRATDPHPTHAGPARRSHRRGRNHRKPRARPSVPSGHGLRLQRDPCAAQGAPHQAGHLPESDAKTSEASCRPPPLRQALPRRNILPRPKALPRPRNSLREDGPKLPRPASARLLRPLAPRPAW